MTTLSDVAARLTPATLRAVALDSANKAGMVAEARTHMRMSGRVLRVRKGNLIRSVRFRVSADPNGAMVEVSAGAPGVHIKPHEFGAIIRAKGGYLAFKIGTSWVRTRSVEIPKRPTLGPSVREAFQGLDDIVSADLRAALLGRR